MQNPEEKKTDAPQAENPTETKKTYPSNWITDMYDKMNIPVKVLDAAIIVLLALIVFLFVFGNQIQLGL